jgi:type III secretion protein L
MPLDEPTLPVAPTCKPLGPVVRGHEVGIWGQAAEALAAAERHCDSMRASAQEAYQRERQRGYDDGWAAGAAEAARLVAAAAARVEQHANALEKELPALVADIVGQILGSFDPGELLSHAVRHAVGQVRTGADLHLRVAPQGAESLRRSLADLARPNGAGVRIEVDPAIKPGDCVLCSEFGNIELGIAAQVRALREELEAQVGRAEVGSAGADAMLGRQPHVGFAR